MQNQEKENKMGSFRILKFRAWQKHYKEMYQPHEGWIEFHNGEPSLIGFDDGDLQIKPEGVVLMQYTGLLDKNGKEIYEGDIVKTKYRSHTAVIEWDDNFASFCMTTIDNDVDDERLYDLGDVVEVIGNIYENPKLTTPKGE